MEILVNNPIRICLTCVGGVYSYSYISALRDADDYETFILGVDSDPNAKGKEFTDSFETVPSADLEEAYLSSILDICKKFEINLMIPNSEMEARIVSKNINIFVKNGIICSVGKFETVGIMTDKLRMLQFLKAKNVDTGLFYQVKNIEEAEIALGELGYPEKKVVFKPRRGSGSRGVLIANSNIHQYYPFLSNRFCGTGSFEAIKTEVKMVEQTFTDYMAMPFMGDIVYDIDCLSNLGRPVNVIPRKREYENPLSPVNQGCVIAMEPSIIDYVEQLCIAFEVHGACDYDIALDETGRPRILDASCRLSGSVGASYVAGTNIPAQLVRVLMGIPLKKYNIQNGMRLRPIQHFAGVKKLR